VKPTSHRIYKAHGAGNDFVILIGSADFVAEELAATARELCDRHRSIGADGLVWVDTCGLPAIAQAHVWNPDGSAVGMCLNAARCVMVLLHDLFDVEQVEIRFPGVAIHAWPTPGGARLQFELQATARSDLSVNAIGRDEWFVNLADPHVVVGWDDAPTIQEALLAEIALAHASGGGLSDRPPNCHLVTHDDGLGNHRIRSFERRVEAETQACGSGCVASYLALSLEGEHTFHTGSGDRIRLARINSRWMLEGPALVVFAAEVNVAALAGSSLVTDRIVQRIGTFDATPASGHDDDQAGA